MFHVTIKNCLINAFLFKAQQRKEEHDRRVQEAVKKIVITLYALKKLNVCCHDYRLKNRLSNHPQSTSRFV